MFGVDPSHSCPVHAMAGAPQAVIASGFVSEVQSIQQFIESQSRITSVESLQQCQCTSLSHRISILSKFDVSTATSVSTLIQSGPWTAAQKETLATAVQSRLLNDTSSATDGRRRKNQQLKNFEKYLTDSELALLQDSNLSRPLRHQ